MTVLVPYFSTPKHKIQVRYFVVLAFQPIMINIDVSKLEISLFLYLYEKKKPTRLQFNDKVIYIDN